MSADELERVSGATHHMRSTGHAVFFVTVGDAILDLEEHAAREVIRRVTSRIALEQKRAGLPQWWARIFETTGGLHAHLLVVATPELARSWRRSSALAPYLRRPEAVQEVCDFDEVVDYVTMERPPNVRGSSRLGPRAPGSHRMALGGDRVQLSTALRDEALATGRILPWQRSNAWHARADGQAKPVRKAREARSASTRPEPARSPEQPPLAAPAAPEAIPTPCPTLPESLRIGSFCQSVLR